jgi:multidrug efflux pump subunit AcrB
MQLDVNFEVGTDQYIANVLAQNRVSAAQARLPVEVTQQGGAGQEAEPQHPDADLEDSHFKGPFPVTMG